VKLFVPKEMRGLSMPKLFEVSMDEFDVARLLPSFFYLAVTRGHRRGKKVNKPEQLDAYVLALSQHPQVRGFDDARGRRLLDRWIRTSILRMGGAGKSRRSEKIEYLLPLNLLTFKAGWPDQLQRQRNVHEFLYSEVLGNLRRSTGAGPEDDVGTARAHAGLQRILMETFAQGADIGLQPPYDGTYDGTTAVDAETLLCLFFLDGLQPTPPSVQKVPEGEDPALPATAQQLATDALTYLIAMRHELPTQALTRGLLAIINFDLFVYTVRLAYALDELIRVRQLPDAMKEGTAGAPPQLYVDFTRERGSASDDLARSCTERDLAQMRSFFEQIVLMRMLDTFAQDVPSMAAAADLSGPEYLLALVRSIGNPDTQARAQATIGQIRALTLETTPDSDTEEAKAFFRSAQAGDDSVMTCADLLARAQAGTRVESLLKWFGSVGGLNRPYGLMRGLTRLRSGWRYQMSDDLLAALVQLSIVQQGEDEGRRIRLSDFLAFLDSRFGVIVDRLPDGVDDALARAGAAQNLEALKRRLRQMGFFADLSDDFNAQYLEAGDAGTR
jgi:hypothetical protein